MNDSGNLNGARVLVIEDDAGTALIYHDRLAGEGARVTVVANGEEGVELLERNPFDVLLLDLELAGAMQGRDVLEALEERRMDTPVVVTTAHDEVDHLIRLLPFGVTSYHVKGRETFQALPQIVRSAIALGELKRRLRTTEENLFAIFDHSPVGIVLLDSDNRAIIEANGTFFRIVAGSADRSSEAFDRFTQTMLHATSSIEKEVSFTLHHETEGLRQHFDVYAVPFSRRGRREVVAFVADVTEREAAARELSAARSRMQFFLDQSPLMFAFASENGIIEEVNRATERLLGRPAAEIIGRTTWDFVEPAERQGVEARWREILREPTDEPLLVPLVAGAGESLMVEVRHMRVDADTPTGAGYILLGGVIDERREAELRAKVLFEEALTAILVVDATTSRIIDANARASEKFGFRRKELHDLSLIELVAEADRQVVGKKLEGLRSGSSESVAGQWTALRKGGGKFPFGFRARKVVAAGRPMIFLIGRDLTEVREEENRYRLLFERASEPVVVLDRNSLRIADCNPAFERLVGRSREELIRISSLDLRSPEERERIAEVRKSLLRLDEGEHLEYESTFARSDGSTVFVAMRTALLELGGESVFVSFIRDVTEQKLAEARYRSIFMQGDDALVICDGESGRVVEVNPAFERLFAAPRASIEGSACGELFDEPDAIESLLREVGGGEELTALRTAKAPIPVGVRVSDITLGSRRLLMFSVRDRRAEIRTLELERSLVQAQKMQSLGQMASGIAHDFNNTLMAALPWADLLRKKYPQDELIQKAADQVRRSVHRARDVTRQLLEFAQPRKPQPKSVDLLALLTEQMKIIRPAIPPEIELVFRPEEDALFDVKADPGQISQMLLNLALNARDAMPSGGVLTIALRSPRQDEAQRWHSPADRSVVVDVIDTGVGIEKSAIEHIFDPFFTTKDLGKGVGLGLSVVHRIAAQHGARLFVESEIGRGTAFHIVFPRVPREETTVSERAAAEGETVERYEGLRILIVDDEAPVAAGLKSLLESEGASVTTASRGKVALELLDRGFRPDFVILDLGLPEMAGDEVHREIRRRLADVPILISSGYGDAARLDPLLADGKTRFRQKPYEAEELFREIDEAVSGEQS